MHKRNHLEKLRSINNQQKLIFKAFSSVKFFSSDFSIKSLVFVYQRIHHLISLEGNSLTKTVVVNRDCLQNCPEPVESLRRLERGDFWEVLEELLICLVLIVRISNSEVTQLPDDACLTPTPQGYAPLVLFLSFRPGERKYMT